MTEPPQVVLFTGKGGVGKTTMAAATAAISAAAGRKTLVLSTDPAHSLADVFDVELGDEPVAVAGQLYAAHVRADEQITANWETVRGYVAEAFALSGLDDVVAAELAHPPGLDEICSLLSLRRFVDTGAFDAVLVDCAPTAETLRLLTLPDTVAWLTDRVRGPRSLLASGMFKALAPTGLRLPDDNVGDAVQWLCRQLGVVAELLRGPNASLRLVLTPERVVVAEARRIYATATVLGFTVDGVIANRVMMSGADDDEWRAGWARSHADRLAEIDESFAVLARFQVPFAGAEPIGVTAVRALGKRAYGDQDPLDLPISPQQIVIGVDDVRIPAPGLKAADLDLVRVEDQLIVTVGGHRRRIGLPDSFQYREVTGAKIVSGELRVAFSALTSAAETSA